RAASSPTSAMRSVSMATSGSTSSSPRIRNREGSSKSRAGRILPMWSTRFWAACGPESFPSVPRTATFARFGRSAGSPSDGWARPALTEGAFTGPALALDENLVLSAGAGAGKTYALVTLCLHLLGGARRGAAPISTGQLFMVTFTDKAATEMRERLRRRLDGLSRGEGEDGERLLRRSFELHRVPFPERSFWRRVRDELGEATIGTFHALCASILRRAPAGAGID